MAEDVATLQVFTINPLTIIQNVTFTGAVYEHIVTGLIASTSYKFKVRFQNLAGVGPWSATATQQTSAPAGVVVVNSVAFDTTLDLAFSAWESKKTSVVAAVATKFSVSAGNVEVLSARKGSTIVEFKLTVTNVAAATQAVTTMQQEASAGTLSLGGVDATAVSAPVSLTSTGNLTLSHKPP